MCPRSKDIAHFYSFLCISQSFSKSHSFIMLLMIPFSLLTFFFFFALFTFVCWCSGSYCTGRYACTVHHCSLWECLWSKVGQKAPWFILPINPLSLRWASRGDGWCRQVKLFCFSTHTHRASVHNLLNTNNYDEVCTKDHIIYSASFSFIILSSLCQSLQLLFRQTWTFCAVVTSLMRLCSLQKYSWMTSCWHTQSSWPQTSSSRSCFSSILSPHQNHKCQPLQFWKSSMGDHNPIIRWFIQVEHGPVSSSLNQCFC